MQLNYIIGVRYLNTVFAFLGLCTQHWPLRAKEWFVFAAKEISAVMHMTSGSIHA